MAATDIVSGATRPNWRAVILLRIGIVAAILVIWELVAASGLLYRDVVPSLLAIGKALAALLTDPAFYWHLGVTVGEIGSRARDRRKCRAARRARARG